MRTHIITMLVENQPGVLAKVSGLFSRRGYNIDTICVGETLQEGIGKIVLTVKGDSAALEQIEKQCNKLIDVRKVNDIERDHSIIKELCLAKVSIRNDQERNDIIKFCEIYRATIIDITQKAAVIQIVDEAKQINSLLSLMKKYGIKNVTRTGEIGLNRVNGG